MITDPIVIVLDVKLDAYVLVQGPETFFAEDGSQLSWPTIESARTWAVANLGKDPFEHLPEPARTKAMNHPDRNRQPRLI